MVAAGKVMAEFMGEKDREKCNGEGKADEKADGIFVEESEGAEKFVERCGLVVGIGHGELRASGQASAEREKKERDGEDEGFTGRASKNGFVECDTRRKSVPVIGEREGVETGIGGRRGHKEFRSQEMRCKDKYSTSGGGCASGSGRCGT